MDLHSKISKHFTHIIFFIIIAWTPYRIQWRILCPMTNKSSSADPKTKMFLCNILYMWGNGWCLAAGTCFASVFHAVNNSSCRPFVFWSYWIHTIQFKFQQCFIPMWFVKFKSKQVFVETDVTLTEMIERSWNWKEKMKVMHHEGNYCATAATVMRNADALRVVRTNSQRTCQHRPGQQYTPNTLHMQGGINTSNTCYYWNTGKRKTTKPSGQVY